MRLLIATTNPGKLREILAVLRPLPLTCVGLDEYPPIEEPDETGVTFAANALLKARYYASATGLPTVAEDSGLSIDALDGRPGVLSARYPGATYAEKFARLYDELRPHPRPWTARFVCSLACVRPDPAAPPVYSCEATVEGEVAAAPRGTGGFGYDPIFFYPPYGTTLGDVSDAEKLAVSHRGKAFRHFAAWLDGQTADFRL
jgi:XTP/dITP diphosphohydrolase